MSPTLIATHRNNREYEGNVRVVSQNIAQSPVDKPRSSNRRNIPVRLLEVRSEPDTGVSEPPRADGAIPADSDDNGETAKTEELAVKETAFLELNSTMAMVQRNIIRAFGTLSDADDASSLAWKEAIKLNDGLRETHFSDRVSEGRSAITLAAADRFSDEEHADMRQTGREKAACSAAEPSHTGEDRDEATFADASLPTRSATRSAPAALLLRARSPDPTALPFPTSSTISAEQTGGAGTLASTPVREGDAGFVGMFEPYPDRPSIMTGAREPRVATTRLGVKRARISDGTGAERREKWTADTHGHFA
ncbi:unnamed protein product [Peniophora sp. CBMAI 1063]|nr:unnamed protein product [Peniophora sp. CBMAI 1063]